MNFRHSLSLFIFPSFIGLLFVILTSCGGKNPGDVILITRISSDITSRNFISGESWRYLSGSQIVAFDPHKKSESPEVLTGSFFSACSPEISCDCKTIVFAGQKNENDVWQIWEMNLITRKTRQITSSDGNCIDPVYLPGGKVVFSMISTNDSVKAGHSLYSCNFDGSDMRRLTFNPGTFFASEILKDGRILTISRQVFPAEKDQILMVLRPDGTKAEIFCTPGNNRFILSRARESENGKILFVEADSPDSGKGNLTSVSYNRPLHSKVNLSDGLEGDFCSVYPDANDKFLVTYRKSMAEHFSVYEFDPATRSLGKEILAGNNYNLVDAVVVRPRTCQRKLPSEVDMMVKTGLIMCQDINVIDPSMEKGKSPSFKSHRIEILGLDSSLGIVEVSADGSFYLKVKADMPFRIQTLDEKGKVINGPCDWIWLRPNERRGCVGCHEDHELAPENRIPLAVKKFPVVLPVHIEKMKDKTVELE